MSPPTATYDDVLAAPEGVRAELIHGELFLQAHPASVHQRVLLELSSELRAHFGRRAGGDDGHVGGWVFCLGPELWLGAPDPQSLVLVPDHAGWRRERWPRQRPTHGITVAPDWVCEILSPSTARVDRLLKADAYARAGVAWYWIVDPVLRFVEVLHCRDGVWTRVAAVGDNEAAQVMPPFDGAAIDIGAWWQALADEDAG